MMYHIKYKKIPQMCERNHLFVRLINEEAETSLCTEVLVQMDIGADGYSRFLGGDNAGLEDIIAEYKESLVLYLVGFCGNMTDAEELMEDVFVKLVVDKPAFKGKSSFKTWLFAIAGNVARDHLRRIKRHKNVSLSEASEIPSDEEDLLRDHFQDENKIMVRRCMDKLKPEYKQVLYLSYFEGFSNTDTARIMKKTNRQIENLLYRAKKSLENELRKEGFEYEE